jgi:hypothetical protein
MHTFCANFSDGKRDALTRFPSEVGNESAKAYDAIDEEVTKLLFVENSFPERLD